MHNLHHSMFSIRVFVADEAATIGLGRELAKCITSGMVVYLQGQLGAGKTTLSRGVLRGFGFTGRVKSPTYTLVEPYVISGLYFYHFDLYRFSDPVEWEDAGFREYFHSRAVCLIEWPEKGKGFLPAADLVITLSVEGSGRVVQIDSCSESVHECLKKKIKTVK